MAEGKSFDCIVVGLGTMGSAACYYLAKSGFRVLGLEQFEVSHSEGSHAGQSRIIRKAYYEHPDYVPLLERAYENWSQIEEEADMKIYHRTGLLYLGQAGSDVMSGVRRSALEHKVTVEEWSRADLKKRYPPFTPASDFQILFEPDAGFVTPERAILSYVQAAMTHSASIHTNERVLSWEPIGQLIRVITPRSQYTTKRLIFTSGAWTSKLIQLPVNLKVTRQTVAWMNPPKHADFMLGNFPCWFTELPGIGSIYGFPILPVGRFGGPVGLKLAHHKAQLEVDADKVDRTMDQNHVDELRTFLKTYIPGGDGDPLAVRTCLYTYSPDEHFIVDHLPGTSGHVTIACGFSGHGYKVASVIGEILADLAMEGKTKLPYDFLKLDRFAS